MSDPERRYMFELARDLHMTVGRMSEEMSYPEFLEHMALDSIRKSEREKADRLAQKGMSQKRPRG